MWSAITSDLKEFVSSVADDGNTVLTKIDTSIKDLDKDDESNLSYTDSLSDLDTSGDISQEIDPTQLVAGDEYPGNSTGYEATGIISDPSDEAMRRMGLEETYTVPLLKDELNGDQKEEEHGDVESKTIHSLSPSDNHDDDDNDDEGEKQNKAESDQVSDNINTKESAVEDELDDGYDDDDEGKVIKRFLKSFDVQAQTEEISKILAKHPDTVGLFFENFVPVVVTYEQFWQRYFYRCDVQRIEREWEEEEERVRLERQEMIDKGVKSVKNMWGGAMKAFQGVASQKQEPKKASIYEKYQAEVEEQQRAMVDSGGNITPSSEVKESKGRGLSFFGNGRPPFTMNTAGSGDDDEEYIVDEDGENAEDDDEDDELGWGSDDEEESESEEEGIDGDESGRNDDVSEDEIVFGEPTLNPANDTGELQRLREELSQLADERDKLQITVESQSKDLEQVHNTDDAIDHNPTSNNDEIELLKMSIFEKDSELAALKASLHDTQEDNSRDEKNQATMKVPDQEIEAMIAKLSARDKELNRLQIELDMASSAKKQADTQLEGQSLALKEANERNNQLSIELEGTKEVEARQTTKVEELNKAVDEAKLAAEEQANTQLEGQSLALKEANERASQLSIELEGTKEVEARQTAKVEELNKAADEAKLAAEAMQATQVLSEQTIKDLTARVSDFESSGEQESRLKEELEEIRTKLEEQKNDFDNRMAAEIEKVRVEHTRADLTPDSISPQTSTSSSVVNVTPQPVEPNLDSATNEEDDGWGDSWSEGDGD